jgi:hypothetical protein
MSAADPTSTSEYRNKSQRQRLHLHSSSSSSLLHSSQCRRVSLSSILVLCGILLGYGVVSTAKFLSWFPHDSEHALKEEKIILLAVKDTVKHTVKDLTLSKRNSSLALLFSVRETQSKSPVSPFAIFYNVFIPNNQGERGVQRSLFIVKEQMDQVGRSYAGSLGTVTVYYNTIGMPGALNATFMTHVCSIQNNINCVHMNHYNDGFEEVTLQKLFEFCHYHDQDVNVNVNRRVIYMHNKGSYQFHSGVNDLWRRHLTTAVTSQLCLKPPEESCNVCSLTFHPLFLLIYPGNFFAADCNYVRKLIPPAVFNSKMKALLALRRQKIAENPAYEHIFANITQFDKFGQGRYAPTHWIGSSPLLNPCTLTSQGLKKWFVERNALADFSWSLLPRTDNSDMEAIRNRQYNVIGGNLFKWFALYNMAPPDDSWAWRWFPDGQKWKQAVARYGNRTVHVVVASETKRLENMNDSFSLSS